jgi:hypothetical protein
MSKKKKASFFEEQADKDQLKKFPQFLVLKLQELILIK